MFSFSFIKFVLCGIIIFSWFFIVDFIDNANRKYPILPNDWQSAYITYPLMMIVIVLICAL